MIHKLFTEPEGYDKGSKYVAVIRVIKLHIKTHYCYKVSIHLVWNIKGSIQNNKNMKVVDIYNNWTIYLIESICLYMMSEYIVDFTDHTGADQTECCQIIWEFTGIPEATVCIFTSLDDVVDI